MKIYALAALLALASVAPAGAANAPPAGGMPQMPPVSTDPAKMPAGHYVSDPKHTFLTMKVHHMGLTYPTMRMNKVDATYDFDPAKPTEAKVNATIDANSFDFGDPAISTQFAKEFLDGPAHPQIKFVSTSIKRGAGNKGTMTGDLTLKGVTKPVTLDVTYDGFLNAMGGRSGFSATGVVKRSDFGPNAMPPSVLGDDVHITIEMEFSKKG